MSTEVAVKDRVQIKGGLYQGIVVAQFGICSWVLLDNNNYSSPCTYRTQDLVKIEPVFEVGKMYVPRMDASPHFRCVYSDSDVAFFSTDKRWTWMRQDRRDLYSEMD